MEPLIGFELVSHLGISMFCVCLPFRCLESPIHPVCLRQIYRVPTQLMSAPQGDTGKGS
eukprot:COSAG01_NODE_67619_length_266_cov_0.934132_1_plen_58_part_01